MSDTTYGVPIAKQLSGVRLGIRYDKITTYILPIGLINMCRDLYCIGNSIVLLYLKTNANPISIGFLTGNFPSHLLNSETPQAAAVGLQKRRGHMRTLTVPWMIAWPDIEIHSIVPSQSASASWNE